MRTPPLRQLGIDSVYLVTGFPLALVSFIVVVTGVAVGTGLSVIVVGLPILVATLYAARGFAHVERVRIGNVLRADVTFPRYKKVEPGSGFWRRVLRPLTDGQAWLDALHAVLHLIPAVAGFAFVVTWWAGALGGLTFPLWDWSIPRGPRDANTDLPELLGLGESNGVRIAFYMTLGVFFTLTLYPVMRGVALIQAYLGKLLLSGVAELREQISAAEAGRDSARAQKEAAVSAEATALRRLERDIHDGPQQRLVRLAMDLGRAQQQIDNNPEVARATVAEALVQARETLDELRALSRGIAPPILVDRGLTAALAALAGRCTIPVELDAPDFGRLVPAVESTAYFVVAEALTNVAKHSAAEECQVTLRRDRDRGADAIVVVVSDNGVGGAHLAKGHGLTGLADRVQAAGGAISVESPAGAGTTLKVRLPL